MKRLLVILLLIGCSYTEAAASDPYIDSSVISLGGCYGYPKEKVLHSSVSGIDYYKGSERNELISQEIQGTNLVQTWRKTAIQLINYGDDSKPLYREGYRESVDVWKQVYVFERYKVTEDVIKAVKITLRHTDLVEESVVW